MIGVPGAGKNDCAKTPILCVEAPGKGSKECRNRAPGSMFYAGARS
jgi:hypothetical protein